MSTSLPARLGLIFPGVLTIIGLGILIGLGTWQLQRKAEKEALIQLIEARRDGAPLVLGEGARVQSASETDYLRVTATGRFVKDKARFYYAPQPQLGPGYDVYEPLQYAPDKIVWVNRGFIPDRLRATPDAWAAPSGDVTIIGTARKPAQPGAFTPDNNVSENVWYWRDLQGMHGSAFGPDAAGMTAANVFLVSEPETVLSDVDRAQVSGGPWPKPGVTRLVIFNRHLEYALTWFGLALTLAVVFLAYAMARMRAVRGETA